MSNLWLKIKIWTKVTIGTILVLYILFFVYHNGNKPVTIWWLFFNDEFQTHLIPILFFTFVFGVIVTILVRTTFRTIRQVREMKARTRTERLEQAMADMKAKAARLQTKRGPEAPPASPEE